MSVKVAAEQNCTNCLYFVKKEWIAKDTQRIVCFRENGFTIETRDFNNPHDKCWCPRWESPEGKCEEMKCLSGLNYISRKSISIPETSSGYAADATHYQALSEQPIEIIQKLFSAEQLKGFLLGNVIKYTLRCGLKDDPVKEMQKVAQYAAWYVDVAEGRRIDPRGDKNGGF